MRIKKLAVKGLFGIFDHKIPLNIDDGITIIHGPNGFGKTALLRLLNNFFNARYAELRNTSFDSFTIEFDNDSRLTIIRKLEESEKASISFEFHNAEGGGESFSPNQIRDKGGNLSSQVDLLDNHIPGLERMGPDQWIDLRQEEMLTLEEAIERYLPKRLRGHHKNPEPDWLKEIKDNIHVRLIESQRLLNFVSTSRFRRDINRPPMLSTVSAYSNELAELIQEKLKEYGTKSQALDRTFPLRVMNKKYSTNVTEGNLRQQLSKIEDFRSGLIEVGLLDKDETSNVQVPPQNMDENIRNTLSVYVEDVEEKLSVFVDTARKIELLRKMINDKFSYSQKIMNFSKEKGFIFETHYPSDAETKKLSPTDLSSGEQHELVLLYELLFKVEPNSLVLIDEPELSLHVTWQAQFLKDLQEIMKLTNLSVLMATHSPDIIQDRWDLTVSLAEDEE